MDEASTYAYPEDLARFVVERWVGARPACDVLERLYATCYQASQLSEEGRPVTVRVILAAPDEFPARGGPPDDIHRLDFQRPLAFDARELRRLSAAADFARSMIGVSVDDEGGLQIWGLVHQGSRWLHEVVGGRGGGPALPPVPSVHVLAPGSIEARCGVDLVGRLEGGRLSGVRVDVFECQWLHDDFQMLQDDLNRLHGEARDRAEASGARWARPEPNLARIVGEQMVKRVISLIRRGRHGGTMLFVPDRVLAPPGTPGACLDIKYPFAVSDARRRFFDLLLDILNTIAPLHARAGRSSVCWADFQSAAGEELAVLDEALFELANLIAGLTSVDGAVVLDKHLEILGFGAEISGRLPNVPVVDRALDPDGGSVSPERAANEGTRHRSAYRLVGALPGALAIVVSQDGGAQFVTGWRGRVTYWEHE